MKDPRLICPTCKIPAVCAASLREENTDHRGYICKKCGAHAMQINQDKAKWKKKATSKTDLLPMHWRVRKAVMECLIGIGKLDLPVPTAPPAPGEDIGGVIS